MIKHAKITPGVTPTETGRVSEKVCEGEPVRADEEQHPDAGLKRSAEQLHPLVGEEGE